MHNISTRTIRVLTLSGECSFWIMRRIHMDKVAINLRPLGDRVVIEPAEGEEVTTGGILLPETAKEKPQQGTIIAIGTGRRDDNGKLVTMDVKLDDKVLYARYSGSEIKINNKKLLILKETDILAVVNGSSTPSTPTK